MIALLRKDLPWLLVVGVGGLVTLSIVLCQEGFLYVWVLPPARLEGTFHASWICGAVLGFVAAGYDEALGRREFLRHRPVSPVRLHAARVLGCALVLLCWFVLTPITPWLTEAGFGWNADLLRTRHAVSVVATMLPAASTAAIALFGATLPTHLSVRLGVSAAAFFLVFSAIEIAATPIDRRDDWLWSLPWFALLHGATALLFTAASFALPAHAHDPDRPWPEPSRSIGAGLGTTVFAAFVAAVLAMLQGASHQTLQDLWPQLTRVDGTLQLAIRRLDGPRFVWYPVDREHRVTGPRLESRVERPWDSSPRATLRSKDLEIREPRFHPWHTLVGRCALLHLEDGIHLLQASWRGRALLTPARRPDGTPLAPDASLLVTRGPGRQHTLVLEPGRALWRIDDEDPQRLHPLHLPGDDRLHDVRTVRPDDQARKARIEIEDLVYQAVDDQVLAIVGANGVYELRGDDVVPARDWVHAQVTRREVAEDPQPRAHGAGDPLHEHVRLVAADGTVLFEHDYAPRTVRERLHAALMLLWSCARPPVLQLPSHLGAATTDASAFADPLIAGGRRTWLVALGVALALLCAFAAQLRLRRFGAPAPVRRFWFALTALLGPAALLASCVVERRRAYALAPDAAPPPLRIHTP